jgi:hypothetical protein
MNPKSYYRLITRLIELKTGKVLRTIDNSANYQVTIVSTTVMVRQALANDPPTVWYSPYLRIGGALLGLALLGLLGIFILKLQKFKYS